MPKMLVTSSSADCHAIYRDNDHALRFGETLRLISPFEALFGSEMIDGWNGANHATLRRRVSAAFNGEALRGYEQAMVGCAQRRLQQWPVDRPVRLLPLMQQLTRDVIVTVVFGVTAPERRARLERAFDQFNHLLGSPSLRARYLVAMAGHGEWPRDPKLDRVNATIDAITLQEIADRRENPHPEPRPDCLDVFLRLQDEDGSALMDDRTIALFQRMLLVAGTESSGVTLSWVLERIVRHPQVLAELEASLARGEDDYLDAVITETMRLRPAQPTTVRYAKSDFQMNNVLVPAGTLILVWINAIHKRADLHRDPERFDPGRFLHTRPDPSTWLPFGGGAYRCLGGSFAMFEARVLLRTILQQRRLLTDTSPSERQDQHRSILLLPHKDATVTLSMRNA